DFMRCLHATEFRWGECSVAAVQPAPVTPRLRHASNALPKHDFNPRLCGRGLRCCAWYNALHLPGAFRVSRGIVGRRTAAAAVPALVLPIRLQAFGPVWSRSRHESLRE